MLWKIVSRVSGRGWLNRCFCRRWNREIRRMSLWGHYKCSIGTLLFFHKKKQLHGFPLSGKLIAFFPFFLAEMMLHQTKKKRRANKSYSFCCFSIETMLMRWKGRLVGSIFPFLLKCFSIALMGNDSLQHLGKSTFFFLGNHVASNCGKRTSMAKRELFRNVSI